MAEASIHHVISSAPKTDLLKKNVLLKNNRGLQSSTLPLFNVYNNQGKAEILINITFVTYSAMQLKMCRVIMSFPL